MTVYFYILFAYSLFGVSLGLFVTWLFVSQSRLEKILAVMKDQNHAK